MYWFGGFGLFCMAQHRFLAPKLHNPENVAKKREGEKAEKVGWRVSWLTKQVKFFIILGKANTVKNTKQS
jgi:hypothetical protein